MACMWKSKDSLCILTFDLETNSLSRTPRPTQLVRDRPRVLTPPLTSKSARFTCVQLWVGSGGFLFIEMGSHDIALAVLELRAVPASVGILSRGVLHHASGPEHLNPGPHISATNTLPLISHILTMCSKPESPWQHTAALYN